MQVLPPQQRNRRKAVFLFRGARVWDTLACGLAMSSRPRNSIVMPRIRSLPAGRRQASYARKAGTVPTGIKRPKNTKAATKVAALVLSDYFSRVIFLSLRTIFPRSCSSSLRFSSLSIPSRRCFGAYPHPRILTFLVPDILIQHY